MRHVYACAVLCALSAVAGFASSSGTPVRTSSPVLTIVLDFRGTYAARSVEEMEREVENITRDSGWAIQWRSWKQATEGVFEEMTIVRFNGNCGVPPWPHLSPEGPLGFTHVSDGVVLPFSDIACEKIASFLRPSVSGMDPAQAELVFGRAMGRVVAHELVHMISRSAVHSRHGVGQPELSESQLTGDRLDLSPKDLVRISGKDSH
jgi:hypothetical protein